MPMPMLMPMPMPMTMTMTMTTLGVLLLISSSLNCFFSTMASASATTTTTTSTSTSPSTSPSPSPSPSRISLDSKISVSHPSSDRVAVSPKGHFAFGFSRRTSDLPPSQYILGVRFNSPRIPSPADQALVWVAGGGGGGGVSVGQQDDSYFHLTKDGNMVLFDGVKRAVAWSSNTCHRSVVSATLLDDGNLVLLDAGGAMLWQSFATPSDTLLPGQNLTSLQLLRAATSNSISSYYSLRMDAASGGQLMLTWESNITYWKTDAHVSSPPASALTFTDAGALMLLDQDSSIAWSRFADDHNDSSVPFRYLRLDVDGNLRMYSWSDLSRSWKVVWQAVQNQCEVFATCGLRGICTFSPSGLIDCSCPFHLASSGSSNLNCLTPYNKDKCSSSGSTMLTLLNTFLYGIYPPHDLVVYVGAQGCRRMCMEDPLCTSASVRNDGSGQCLLKRTQFVTGFQSPSLASTTFVKECLDPLAVLPHNFFASPPAVSPSQAGSFHKFWHPYYFLGAVLGAILTLLLVQIIAGFCLMQRGRKDGTKGIGTLTLNSIGIVSVSYAELQKLTDDFREHLGPNVHKGMLPGDHIIVVKDLKDLAPVEEKQFRCWISVLGGIYHKNLVKLVAYSYSSDRRFVVYPFIKNASVDKWLKEAKLAKRLSWSKRMEICLGVARAMSYLHSGCRQFISHGNLKWNNVLLDEQFEAKLTDYGFAKFSAGASRHGPLAEEDVARFGEMLVTMVTGIPGGSEVCWWAYEEWAACHVDKLIDARMAGKADFGDVERMLRVAFWCVQDDARLRPSVSEVTKVLEGSLPVDPPPPPHRMLATAVDPSPQIEELC